MNGRDDLELRLWRVTEKLRTVLAGARDVPSAVRYALKAARELLAAEEAAAVVLRPGKERAEPLVRIPAGSDWNLDRLTTYLMGDHRGLPTHLYLGKVMRKGRPWAVLVLKNPPPGPNRRYRQAVREIAAVLSGVLEDVDRRRVRGVRERIERKMMDQVDPKDLLYTILHGLRSLTRYDHSASLLVCREGTDFLDLVAEQVAWKKGKSVKVGTKVTFPAEVRRSLDHGRVFLFQRVADALVRDGGNGPDPVATLLDYNRGTAGVPVERSMICAPFHLPDHTVGILRVAALHPGSLGAYEAELVDAFVPQASMALQLSLQRETFRARMIDAQRRQAVANITRGIAHDVNNALGSVLLLLQQMQVDLQETALAGSPFANRLELGERSIQTCRRIFDGMLTVARGTGKRTVGHGNVRRAVDSALAVFSESMSKRRIRPDVKLPEEIPVVRCGQADLTSLFLNLAANARDAMPGGGKLTIRASVEPDRVVVTTADTGTGIPADIMERIDEPFFTTKTQGTGLGLAICHSILTEVGGRMSIESLEGEGTSVRVVLPLAVPGEESS